MLTINGNADRTGPPHVGEKPLLFLYQRKMKTVNCLVAIDISLLLASSERQWKKLFTNQLNRYLQKYNLIGNCFDNNTSNQYQNFFLKRG